MSRPPSHDDEPALWERWHQDHTAPDRALLVDMYAKLVRRLAARCYARRASNELEFCDFFQFGMVGLLEAIDRYRPDRGARFETFATYRIEGAILNGVQSLSERQQQVSTRRRILQERSRSVAGTDPVATSALERLANIAIGLALGFALEDSGIYADGEATAPDNAYAKAETAQLQKRLAKLVQLLSDQERCVIHRHYFQQMQFEEIASSLGLSKARISQVHRAALQRLRALYREQKSAVLVA